jgi:hypothetical protein
LTPPDDGLTGSGVDDADCELVVAETLPLLLRLEIIHDGTVNGIRRMEHGRMIVGDEDVPDVAEF